MVVNPVQPLYMEYKDFDGVIYRTTYISGLMDDTHGLSTLGYAHKLVDVGTETLHATITDMAGTVAYGSKSYAEEDVPLTFKVTVAEGYENPVVDVNGETLTPDANGVYTFTPSRETVEVAIAITATEKPTDWPEDPAEEYKSKTAKEVFGDAIPAALDNVSASALAVWAKVTGNVNFADKSAINADAFILNCANDAVEEATKDFKITADDLATILAAVQAGKEIPDLDRDAYPNAKIVITEVTLPGADTTTAKFWKAELKLK